MNLRENIPLAPLTTFEIGGVARFYTEARGLDDIREAIAWAKHHEVSPRVIAGGSNLLIPDEGLDALVIRIVSVASHIVDSVLEADAGCNLLALVTGTARAGFTGWEKTAGIPGTLGGAIRGNAGAFGTEIKDVLESCRAINIETDEVRMFSKEECGFSYRNSFFKEHPAWVILSARLNFAEGDRYESEQMIGQTIRERERRHLQNVRAAGSYFMNPVVPWEVQKEFEIEKETKAREGRVPAGWLIEKVGMKGARVGGAIASQQHPNYIVNENNATAADVRRLAARIQEKVQERFGVILQEEVTIL